MATHDSGSSAAFETIPLSPIAPRKLANPQAAYAFDIIGTGTHATDLHPAPAFVSAEMAAELGEVYWQALTRVIPFRDIDINPDIAAAIDDLNNFSAMLRAPKKMDW